MKSEQLDNVKKLNKEEKKSNKMGTSDGHMVSHKKEKKVKIKSEGKPMKFYKQKGKEGKVHVGAFKE